MIEISIFSCDLIFSTYNLWSLWSREEIKRQTHRHLRYFQTLVTPKDSNLIKQLSWAFSSMVVHLPSVHDALGSIPSVVKPKLKAN